MPSPSEKKAALVAAVLATVWTENPRLALTIHASSRREVAPTASSGNGHIPRLHHRPEKDDGEQVQPQAAQHRSPTGSDQQPAHHQSGHR